MLTDGNDCWLRLGEALEYTQVSRKALLNDVESGKIPYRVIGNRRERQYRRSDLDNIYRIQVAQPAEIAS